MLMYPITLLNLLVSTVFWLSSIYKIILSANRQFYFFLSNLDTFFSYLIALARTSSTILNSNSECGHPCLVPDLNRKALNLSLSNVMLTAAAAAESLQSCPTLCDHIDSSPPGSPVPGILQARTLQWVAISFCNAWKWKVKVKSLSRVQPSATPWTATYQAPPSMGFSRQEYWSGVPLPY